jgi:hypothetical protein
MRFDDRSAVVSDSAPDERALWEGII